jgi:hypothetical protein
MIESPDPSPSEPLTGGCQCGAVRYALHAPLEKPHYCHCRMCQRATGNLFAALVGVPKDMLEWTHGQPSFYASSTIAARGFCAQCGTPLSFAYREASRIYVTIGSLDQPARAQPIVHYGVESQLPWLRIDDALPREATADNEALRTMTGFQFQGLTHG